MDMSYDWRFTAPDSRLLVHMENWREGAMQFDATMTLERVPITARRSRPPCCATAVAAQGDGGHLLAGLQAVAEARAVPHPPRQDRRRAPRREGRIERLAQ